MNLQELQNKWEEKQAIMKELCDKEVDGREEMISVLYNEIHELMRQHWELQNK